MRIGAHVPPADPAAAAAERGATVVQIFLSSPRQWAAPQLRSDAWVAGVAELPLYVHAPYLVNLASADPAVRERSTSLLQATLDEATRIGALGVVVHAGQGGVDATTEQALTRFLDAATQLSSPTPLLVENTCTGQVSLGRDVAVWEELFARLAASAPDVPVGACLDTCHLWAGPDWEEPTDTDVAALAARFVAPADLGLLHVNDSHVPAGGGQDRHANLAEGTIPASHLNAMVAAAADRGWTDAVIETPGDAAAHAADLRWLTAHVPTLAAGTADRED